MKSQAALACFAAMFAASAAAEPVSPISARQALQTAGAIVNAQTKSADETSQFFDATIDDVDFTLSLSGCDRRGCDLAVFFTFAGLEGGATLEDYAIASQFNEFYPFGRVYVIEEDSALGGAALGVDLVVELSDENRFAARDVEVWRTVLAVVSDDVLGEGSDG